MDYQKIKRQWFLRSNNALMIGDQKSDMDLQNQIYMNII